MGKRQARFWEGLPITHKLFLEIALTAAVLFASSLLIYAQINRLVVRMDSVYPSSINLSELSECLGDVQNFMYKYLEVRGSDFPAAYYRAEQEYRDLLNGLSTETTDNPIRVLGKNIRNMSETCLMVTGKAVQAKRGLNMEKYGNSYESALKLFQYTNQDIDLLNGQQFRNNSASYQALQSALRYLEIISLVILCIAVVINLAVMMMLTRDITTLLTNPAQTAELVGQGNFHVKMTPIQFKDELGTVTGTFNQMMDSLDRYVNRIRESTEKEQEMRARELLMKDHLKEARLRYLQSQINPRFLFSPLNAGIQLAIMEDARKTSVFVEKMADLFRYNVKERSKDVTIREEVRTVENYIYILNVWFAGDIHYDPQVNEGTLEHKIPSVILQLLVENAVNHGICGIEQRGEIRLKIEGREGRTEIYVEDNGRGITEKQIREILSGARVVKDSDPTGVDLGNVMSRLRLYYGTEQVFQIASEEKDCGTAVILTIPNAHAGPT